MRPQASSFGAHGCLLGNYAISWWVWVVAFISHRSSGHWVLGNSTFPDAPILHWFWHWLWDNQQYSLFVATQVSSYRNAHVAPEGTSNVLQSAMVADIQICSAGQLQQSECNSGAHSSVHFTFCTSVKAPNVWNAHGNVHHLFRHRLKSPPEICQRHLRN